MQPAFDRNTLDRLISLGRQQGQLTTEDLRASLPIESMNAEEIALVVVHLEETGIPVELEDSLLSPNPKPGPVERPSAEIIPFPSRRVSPKAKPHVLPLQPAQPPRAEAPEHEVQVRDGAHWIVAAAGLFVLVVLGIILISLGM